MRSFFRIAKLTLHGIDSYDRCLQIIVVIGTRLGLKGQSVPEGMSRAIAEFLRQISHELPIGLLHSPVETDNCRSELEELKYRHISDSKLQRGILLYFCNNLSSYKPTVHSLIIAIKIQ